MAEQDNANNGAGAQANQQGQKSLQIQRIYVKDFSFESPQSPQVFSQADFRPEFKMNLGNQARQVGEDLYEVVLTVSVEARQDDKPVFLAELHHAGLFTVTGFEKEEADVVLGSFCPAQLYPYAREVITSTVVNGGFPAPQLQPVNFDQLYQRQREQQAGNEAQQGGQA
ncbi:protein-export chaperone SecB [Gammaproteobacteria bacterium AB-CW1]|uniref:Protein-export protein SecB n=1 Tax=Natronospira elongata TaxID=3110268 RepID=A0AAP6JDG4_9GAMM|nr:protein-export chaperone SecB [Gammaproteobacteria bacterium AB-CW1]